MRHWDDRTDAEADALFATFSESEIRWRQDLCRAQIVTAHRARNDDALADLRRMEDALQRAMFARLAPRVICARMIVGSRGRGRAGPAVASSAGTFGPLPGARGGAVTRALVGTTRRLGPGLFLLSPRARTDVSRGEAL